MSSGVGSSRARTRACGDAMCTARITNLLGGKARRRRRAESGRRALSSTKRTSGRRTRCTNQRGENLDPRTRSVDKPQCRSKWAARWMRSVVFPTPWGPTISKVHGVSLRSPALARTVEASESSDGAPARASHGIAPGLTKHAEKGLERAPMISDVVRSRRAAPCRERRLRLR